MRWLSILLKVGVILSVTVLALSGTWSLQYVHAQAASGGGDSACPSPPANFDILHASLGELHYYGLPRPPMGDAATQAAWARNFDFHHITRRICGGEMTGSRELSHPLQGQHPKGALGFTNFITDDRWSSKVSVYSGMDRAVGAWNVPNDSFSVSGSTEGAWVGIGGFNGNNLWQAGTEADPVQGYRMWYEAFPNPPVYAGPAVGPGDPVYVSVDYNYSYSNQSYVFMENQRYGVYYTKVVNFQPDRGDAEWIVERTGCPSPLAQFTNIYWSNIFWQSVNYAGNAEERIDAVNNYSINMWNSTVGHMDYALALGVDGNGYSAYTTTWNSAGENCV